MLLSFYVERVLWGVFDFYLSLKEGDLSNFIKNCAREGKRFKVFDKNDAIIVKGDDFIWNYGDDSESGRRKWSAVVDPPISPFRLD